MNAAENIFCTCQNILVNGLSTATTKNKESVSQQLSRDQRRYFTVVSRDMWLVACVVFGFYMLAASVELSEKVTEFTRGYEPWQLDELPLTLLLLSAVLVWFSFRRMRETRDELSERIRAQVRITELLTHNRDLSQRLILVQENERRSLARELHDEFGQNCSAIRADASYIMHAAVSDNVGTSAKRIAQAAEALSAMVQEIIRQLRPPALDSLGLESALQELCEAWEQQTGIACRLLTRDIPAQLMDSTAITIFRLVQEALTNVTRHAEAAQVRITLQQDFASGNLSLTMLDDGKGMHDPESTHRGFGLIGMRERVAALHGDIRFFSEPGCGLRIAVEMPLEKPAS